MKENHQLLEKWLRVLFYLHAVSIINSVISDLTIYDGTWVGKAITAGVVVCLFQLAPVNGRYRGAAIFRAAMLGCALINPLVLTPIVVRQGSSEWTSVISTAAVLAVLVLSALSVYQEFRGHAEVEPKLSKNWRGLFIWMLGITVLSSCVSFIGVQMQLNLSAVGTITAVIDTVLDILYLWYLHQMIRHLSN